MEGMIKMGFKSVKKTPKAAIGDHSGTIVLPNVDDAFKIAKKLFTQFDKKILDIQVSPMT